MADIIIKSLSKTYVAGKDNTFQVLKDINLHIKKGEILSLIGPSGSGKSTLARIIMGLEKPTRGTMLLENRDYADWHSSDRKAFYKLIQGVFQDAGGTLNPKLSTYHNVEESLVNLTPLNRRQRKHKILDIMDALQLDPRLLKQSVSTLSGGEQRRLSLLRALVVKPKFLVLDEIVSGLDLDAIHSVERLLMSYKDTYQCSYLYITHHLESARRISDRILIMEDGRLIKEGKNQKIGGQNDEAI